jgi:hypothetical protein
MEIHDVVGTTQESLHSIKVKKVSTLVIILDLAKAYEKVSWLYLRLLLIVIHIGMRVQVVDWIMGCLSSTLFCNIGKWLSI